MLERKSRFGLTTDRMTSNVLFMNHVVTALKALIDKQKAELDLTNQRAKDADITQDEVWHIIHASNLRRSIAELEDDLAAAETFG